MTITHEVLPAMKLIKYYGWEAFMEEKIAALRRREEALLAKSAVLKGLNICLVFTARCCAAMRRAAL